MDRGTRYLLIAAAGLGGLLLAGMAGWALIGGHDASVPVIEADSRPLRVKPDHAGGMQVVGAEDQVMGGQGAATRSMAPAAEAPAPQALRAQMQPAAPAPAVVMEQPAPTAPVAATSPAPLQVPVVTAAPPARPAAPAAGGALVQLAAVDTEQVAQAEWQRLTKRMPELLGDRRPVMQRVDRDGKSIWRIRTGGFADIAEATAFCGRVRAKGSSCSIASF